METLTEPLPLGHLLALVHHRPELATTGARGVHRVLCYLTQLPLRTEATISACWPMAVAAVLDQHPWLDDVQIPAAALRERRWAYVWAWLDTQEARHGATLATAPMSEDDWASYGYARQPQVHTVQGDLVRLTFRDRGPFLN